MSHTPSTSAILVAAGSGQRYGGNKLLETIGNLPVLVHSVRAFLLEEIEEIIIVAHPDHQDQYQHLINKHCPDTRIRIITGGAQRWQSSRLGIQAARGEVVAIHDAARPLVDPDHIHASIAAAITSGAALVAAPATDSIKIVHDQENTDAIDRATIYLAQTPQTFRRSLILQAYDLAEQAHFQQMTDESELITRFLHQSVRVIPSTNQNLKITYPSDLAVARAIWELRKKS